MSAAGVYVVSLVSSPGSEKTAFFEKTLNLLRPEVRVAALVGDLATENDASRLARSQAPIPTWRICVPLFIATKSTFLVR